MNDESLLFYWAKKSKILLLKRTVRKENAMDLIIWLTLFVVFLVYEATTLGLYTIWFAGGALIAFIAAVFGIQVEIQISLFVAVSFALLFFTRPILKKYVYKNNIKTNIDTLAGKKAIVTSTINNLKASGAVILNGQEWTARTEDEKEVIEVDEVVEIVKISGVKLIVKKANKGEEG